jgi:hypothetical protein
MGTTGSGMPSARYYVQQARALLSWAQATTDKGKASRLHAQAAAELERAKQAAQAAPDLNPLLSEFNDRQMYKGGKPKGE